LSSELSRFVSFHPSLKPHLGDILLTPVGDSKIGVKQVFGVPGDYNLELLDYIEGDEELQWVGNGGTAPFPPSLMER
jgi:hypothetical protein